MADLVMRNQDMEESGEWDYSSAVEHILAPDGDTECGLRIPDDGFKSGRWWWAEPDAPDEYTCSKCRREHRRGRYRSHEATRPPGMDG